MPAAAAWGSGGAVEDVVALRVREEGVVLGDRRVDLGGVHGSERARGPVSRELECALRDDGRADRLDTPQLAVPLAAAAALALVTASLGGWVVASDAARTVPPSPCA